MSANRLFIAAAGSGKTTLIINEVLANKIDRILITTFTIANAQLIREKLMRANCGLLPANVAIQTWCSFLLEHGVRPYRFWDKRVEGMKLVSQPSALCKLPNGRYRSIGEWETDGSLKYQHYFTASMNVYSDKLAKLVFRCQEKSNGYVIKRLEKIFSHIYVDEAQDMTGWDLELFKLFINSNINFTMVGDPRQAVYSTHPDNKNKKYANGKIRDFVASECKGSCEIDDTTLSGSRRNLSAICALSSELYTELPECKSLLEETDAHMGVYFVKQSDVKRYIQKCGYITQLRNNKRRNVLPDVPVINFGISKGLEFQHVLIYPTKPILEWLLNRSAKLKDTSRADCYVAITRAFFSVAFVVEDDFSGVTDGIIIWNE
jgi:DNA helicase-2/ATP-dependent DNA helicase PcrA